MIGLNSLAFLLMVGQAGDAAVLHKVQTTVNVDSGWTDRYYRIEILSDPGRNRYGDMTQRYDSENYRIETITARTILPDSSVVYPDTSAISDVSAPEVTRAPEYSRLMMRVVTFPALGPHSTIEYHYRLVRKSKKSFWDRLCSLFKKERREPFFSSYRFQTVDPIDTIIYTLKGSDLSKIRYHLTGDVQVQRYGDTMIVWHNYDVPPIVREEGMVPIDDIAPRLLITEFPDWDSVSAFFGAKFRKPLSHGKKLSSLASSLIDTVPDDAARIRTIYEYVLTAIRTVPIDFGEVGYTPTDPATVNKHRYGDPKDKAVLLASLLKDAGFDAQPIAVRKDDAGFIPEIASPEQFDHVIVAVQVGDSTLYLDPTARFTGYGEVPSSLMGKPAIHLNGKAQLFNLPDKTPDNNNISASWNMEISQDGELNGQLDYHPKGSFEEEFRSDFFGMTEDLIKQEFRGYASRVSAGSELEHYELSDVEDINEPAKASLSIKAPNYGVVEGDIMVLELPDVVLQPHILKISLKEHKYPMETEGPFRLNYTWKIKLPKGYRVVYAPDYSDSNDVGKITITHTLENGILKVNKTMEIYRKRVEPAEYPLYRELGQKFTDRSSRIILIEKVGE